MAIFNFCIIDCELSLNICENHKKCVSCRSLFKLSSSRWAPVLRLKTIETLFGSANFSVFIQNYIKINSRIWFEPVNSNFNFQDCKYKWWYFRPLQAPNNENKRATRHSGITVHLRKATTLNKWSLWKYIVWHAAGRWFSLGIPVSSTNITDHHNITEILLKVALNTIILTLSLFYGMPNNSHTKHK